MNVYDDCSRSVAAQPSSNSHLENTLKMPLSSKTIKQACCFFDIRHYFLKYLSVENIGVEPMTS